MATTPTANYGWLMPVPGTEIDTWGPIVNAVFEDIDAEVFLKANIAGQVFTGAIISPNGTEALPGIGIGGTGSGFYVIGASNIGFSIAGVKVLDMTPTTVRYANAAGAATFNVRAEGGAAQVLATRYENSASPPIFNGRKLRGTVAAPLSVIQGDVISTLIAEAYDGTVSSEWGALRFQVFEAAPGASEHGTSLIIRLAPPGSATVTADALSFELTNGLRFSSNTVIDAARAHQLRAYTVATVPTASPAGRLIQVTDEVGGSVPAFSDGTNWRRVTDRQIVS